MSGSLEVLETQPSTVVKWARLVGSLQSIRKLQRYFSTTGSRLKNFPTTLLAGLSKVNGKSLSAKQLKALRDSRAAAAATTTAAAASSLHDSRAASSAAVRTGNPSSGDGTYDQIESSGEDADQPWVALPPSDSERLAEGQERIWHWGAGYGG